MTDRTLRPAHPFRTSPYPASSAAPTEPRARPDPHDRLFFVRALHPRTIYKLTEFDTARGGAPASDAIAAEKILRQALLLLPGDPQAGAIRTMKARVNPVATLSGKRSVARAPGAGPDAGVQRRPDLRARAPGRPRVSRRPAPAPPSGASRRWWSRPMRRSRCRRVTRSSRSTRASAIRDNSAVVFRAENGLSVCRRRGRDRGLRSQSGHAEMARAARDEPALAARGIAERQRPSCIAQRPCRDSGGVIFIGSWADGPYVPSTPPPAPLSRPMG